jgi:Cysteine-rich CPCC
MTFTNITKQRADDGSFYRCPCCGCRTLAERAGYEICPVCYWEDDGQDDHDADEVRGGPNGTLSLIQARESYRKCGASDARHLSNVRKPRPDEL